MHFVNKISFISAEVPATNMLFMPNSLTNPLCIHKFRHFLRHYCHHYVFALMFFWSSGDYREKN